MGVLSDLAEFITPARRVERAAYRCAACGHEFEAPDRHRVQCPECLGFAVEPR